MGERKTEMGTAGAIAIASALGIGLIAVLGFPSGTSQLVSTPAPLIGYLYSENVSCSLQSGVCTMTLINNSTIGLTVQGCDMVLIQTSNETRWHDVIGTPGGPVTAGIPAGVATGGKFTTGGKVTGSCSMPLSQLSHQKVGSFAQGAFTVTTNENWEALPAGTLAAVNFEGIWS